MNIQRPNAAHNISRGCNTGAFTTLNRTEILNALA